MGKKNNPSLWDKSHSSLYYMSEVIISHGKKAHVVSLLRWKRTNFFFFNILYKRIPNVEEQRFFHEERNFRERFFIDYIFLYLYFLTLVILNLHVTNCPQFTYIHKEFLFSQNVCSFTRMRSKYRRYKL